jgi:REP element-mobilizing transposase RayT
MSRVHRLLLTDRIFFVNVVLRPGVKHLRDSEYPLIISVLEASRHRLGFLLCGYVLMPDHWHALMWPCYPLRISQVLHDVKKVSAGKFHARRGSQGPFWQHQFWDRFVRDRKEFNERLEYIHLNPVRKGLVKRPQDWRWSSYNNFALDKAAVAACPIQIDHVRLPERFQG